MSIKEQPSEVAHRSFRANVREAMREFVAPEWVLTNYLKEICNNPEKRQQVVDWMDKASKLPNGVMLHMTRDNLVYSILSDGLGREDDKNDKPVQTIWWRTVGGPNDLPLRRFLTAYQNADNPDTRAAYIASLDIFGRIEARVKKYNKMEGATFQNMLLGKMIRRMARSIIEVSGRSIGASRNQLLAFTNITKQDGEILTQRFAPQSLQTENGKIWVDPSDLVYLGEKVEYPEKFAVDMLDGLFHTPLPIHASSNLERRSES